MSIDYSHTALNTKGYIPKHLQCLKIKCDSLFKYGVYFVKLSFISFCGQQIHIPDLQKNIIFSIHLKHFKWENMWNSDQWTKYHDLLFATILHNLQMDHISPSQT